MRGAESTQRQLFSLIDLEDRIPASHPLRAFKALVEPILRELSPAFDALYAESGRPSIPPEQLLRALVLQVLYTVRSERQLMEQLDFNLLFRWFVGLSLDAPVWHPTVFTKNRDRLLAGDIAGAFLAGVLRTADARRLLSHEHFTVDGTLLEAWASQKSFQPKDRPGPGGRDDDRGNPTVN
ncbi:MAG: transposase, partial [Gemmatimonadaceae bacterium]